MTKEQTRLNYAALQVFVYGATVGRLTELETAYFANSDQIRRANTKSGEPS